MDPPQERYVDIELYINRDSVQVWYQSQLYFSFAVDNRSNEVLLALNDIKLDRGLKLAKGYVPAFGNAALNIFTLIKEKDPIMGLPRSKKEAARTRVISAPRPVVSQPSSSSVVPTIAEGQRDAVLNAILDSMLDHPNQTKPFMASETRRIADKYNERLFAIAGVRANLTRGRYGDVAVLLDQRRMQRMGKRARKVALAAR